MVEGGESLTTDEVITDIVSKADRYVPEGGIKPSEFWTFREEVRAKYDLPECGTRWEDPVGYIQDIEQFARTHNIEIRAKHEFSTYFSSKPDAKAVAFSQDVFRDITLVVEPHKPTDWWALRARANQLSHEIVHAMQYQRYPSMPEDQAEFEAYAYQLFTPVDILRLKNDPEFIASIVNEQIPKDVSNSVNIANPN